MNRPCRREKRGPREGEEPREMLSGKRLLVDQHGEALGGGARRASGPTRDGMHRGSKKVQVGGGACLRFMRANLGGQWDFDGCHLWRWVSWRVLDWEHPSGAGSGPTEVSTSDQETEELKTRIVRHPVPTHSTTHCCPTQVSFCHWSASESSVVRTTAPSQEAMASSYP